MEGADAQLLSATAAGDADAFAELFRRHEAVVTRFALRRCSSSDDVGDVVADTFMAALRGAGGYRPQTPDAVPWLLGIALRLARRQHRSTMQRRRLWRRAAAATPRYEAEEAEAVIAALDAARQAPALEAALQTLSRRDREMLELVAYDGLSPTDAAIALGVSANAARLRLARARSRMRAALNSDEPALATEAPRV